VVPSDGADGSAEWAPRLSADVDEVESWCLSHDGSHVPRFDGAPFGRGNQADIRLAVERRVQGDEAALRPATQRDPTVGAVFGRAR
jgi:hypothetical protein